MYQNRALKPDVIASQNLALAALSYTTTFARRFKLQSIGLSASVGITETVTFSLISAKGSNYDRILKRVTLADEQDVHYAPEGELNLQAGDEIKVECTNANTTGTVYATIKASELTK